MTDRKSNEWFFIDSGTSLGEQVFPHTPQFLCLGFYCGFGSFQGGQLDCMIVKTFSGFMHRVTRPETCPLTCMRANEGQGGIITGNLETRLPRNLCPRPKYLVKILLLIKYM